MAQGAEEGHLALSQGFVGMVQRQAWLAVCRMIGCVLDDLCRVLGGDSLIILFTEDAVACERCHSKAVLWVGLTLGTKTHLVSVESENCTWLSRRDRHRFPLVV
ncbi:hypothetical protein CDL15_Pgr026442 [Punica granatum]|uniref:Uncharacterized protein n=1 Tax=Punica granatum TaxID=22663 RepID=A0A218XHN4_PUNGR|nr:hypothetical protein CDL15_Pgr026442 [Punica granatum]PKI58395.1 hypothetical protein CRG98_021213 [Punica granatum]